MLKYIVKRLVMLVPVMLGVSLVVFVVMHLFAPDPAALILGQHATTAQIEALRQELGLTDPIYVQFGRFLWRLVQGDLGRSLMTRRPVVQELIERFPATIELAFFSLALATVLGIAVGVLSAVKRYTILDYLSMAGALLGVSMPIFWLGLIFIIVFAVNLHWLPVASRVDIGLEPATLTGFYLLDSLFTGNWAALRSCLSHLILPGLALAAYSMAIIARMTRSTMLDVIKQDYIRTARAKGLGERTVINHHALKNALIPVVTVIGLQLGFLLGGAVLTETVFSWPGVGGLTVNAIMASDYPVVQGSVLLVAAVFVLVNLAVDLLYAYLDPRIHYA